ncbi:MAG: N-glycosylase/DNA lyase [Bacteroidetes bacterium]|nr:N-glycosylase/DNA lyase [Bacteroidota bacterium]
MRSLHASRRKAIRRRLGEFRRVKPSEYFYELVYCLLTPQTSAENAGRVVDKLRELSFHELPVDPEPILRSRSTYIRFHRTKSNHLVKLKEEFPIVLGSITPDISPFELREWLVKNVKGLGYKEATHFLRNVGRNGGLAILDRHILRNLKRLGAIRSLPKTLSRKKYLSIEQQFMRFAERSGIPLDELDLLFWSMETGVIRK